MPPRLLAINPVGHPGGAETTTLRLLAGLRARGWATTVTTPTRHSPLAEQAAAAGHATAILPLGGLHRHQGLRALASAPKARHLSTRHDTVLLNGVVSGRLLPFLAPPPPRLAPLGRARTPGRRLRLVLHVHDVVDRVPPFWRLADAIVAASHAVARRLTELDPRVHPVVVHPPVDPDPPPADPPWAADGRPTVGFVGRLEPRKGALDLVAVTPDLRQARPDLRVVVVGADPYRTDPAYTQRIDAAAGLDGPGRIERYPWTENAPGLMRHLDVLVLPARREPFGTVLAEAMAVGTPVVATRVDGLPEVVDDGVTGRLIAPGDLAALTEAILDVLARRATLGPAARRTATERFATDRHVEAMASLLGASAP